MLHKIAPESGPQILDDNLRHGRNTRSSLPSRIERGDEALLELLRLLNERDYQFVTPTPATHARILQRPERRLAKSLRDALGWSLPFSERAIDEEVVDLLKRAGMVQHVGSLLQSKVRVSRLQDRLFLHSAYPTAEPDAVFFGPDSYRFAELIIAELSRYPDRARTQIVDMGTGSGVGAIIASIACPSARVRMTDVNALALRFSRINAAAAGVSIESSECRLLDSIEGELNIITANPPYIIDPDCRLYRDGGGDAWRPSVVGHGQDGIRPSGTWRSPHSVYRKRDRQRRRYVKARLK